MVSRETQIVGGIALFIIVIGIVAGLVALTMQGPTVLDEPLWFRITSDTHDNVTLASISIIDGSGNFKEYMVYTESGKWQASAEMYKVGEVLNIVVFFFETGEYFDASYRIGRGPTAIDTGSYYTEYISYWTKPDY